MKLVATLIADLPFDERRFYGLLRDIAAVATVAAIKPTGMVAKHFFRSVSGEESHADCLVRVVDASTLAPDVLEKLRDCGFRPQSALQFQLARPESDLEDLWELLRHYARELQGWVLTNVVDFDQAVARCGSEEGLMQLPQQRGDDSMAVLISASTMRQLRP